MRLFLLAALAMLLLSMPAQARCRAGGRLAVARPVRKLLSAPAKVLAAPVRVVRGAGACR